MTTEPWSRGRVALVCFAAALALFWVVRLILGQGRPITGWLGMVSMLLIIAGQMVAAHQLKARPGKHA